MKSFHELSFAEQRDIRQLIARAWAESGELGAEAGEDSPPLVTTLAIGDLLGDLSVYPDVQAVDAPRAERACRSIIRRLARRGVVLHGSKWLGSREYYGWLIREFLPLQIRANVAPHRKEELHFVKLAPNSTDNIFRTIDCFIRELLGLRVIPRGRWLSRPTSGGSRMTVERERYLVAWQDSYLAARLLQLRPVAVYDLLAGPGVKVKIEVRYELTDEGRRPVEFSGSGLVELQLERGTWRIRRMAFPGFSL